MTTAFGHIRWAVTMGMACAVMAALLAPTDLAGAALGAAVALPLGMDQWMVAAGVDGIITDAVDRFSPA